MTEKTCSGDCLQCGMPQQIYCAAQRTYALMDSYGKLMERMDRMESMMSRFSGDIINPMKANTAQIGFGAENREPQSNPL